MNKAVANGMSGASNSDRLKSDYSPSGSEILDKNKSITGYYNAKNQESVTSKIKSTVQEQTA